MSKISQKLYVALTRCGVSHGVARHIAESAEFLGDSTPQSAERDEYDIMIVAKALSSLVRRHLDTTPIMPSLQLDAQSSDMTRVGSPLKPKENANKKNSDGAKVSSVIVSARKRSTRTRRALSYILPVMSAISVIVLGMFGILGTVIALGTLLGVSVCGTVLFFAGMLYGVSQISVFFGGAMFELGIALISGGIAVCLSVLLFNFLTRTLPFCLKRGMRALSRIFSESISLRDSLNEKRGNESLGNGG